MKVIAYIWQSVDGRYYVWKCLNLSEYCHWQDEECPHGLVNESDLT